jgi:hypothetical protein
MPMAASFAEWGATVSARLGLLCNAPMTRPCAMPSICRCRSDIRCGSEPASGVCLTDVRSAPMAVVAGYLDKRQKRTLAPLADSPISLTKLRVREIRDSSTLVGGPIDSIQTLQTQSKPET